METLARRSGDVEALVAIKKRDLSSAWGYLQIAETYRQARKRDLAAKREKEHPEDALPVYQGQVEPILQRKHNEAYREAIGLLRKVRASMVRLGREGAFASYLESVRVAHKPKRNFMKLLEGEKWG